MRDSRMLPINAKLIFCNLGIAYPVILLVHGLRAKKRFLHTPNDIGSLTVLKNFDIGLHDRSPLMFIIGNLMDLSASCQLYKIG
jgi:hypothetical protein